jgi:hypothetical protein
MQDAATSEMYLTSYKFMNIGLMKSATHQLYTLVLSTIFAAGVDILATSVLPGD